MHKQKSSKSDAVIYDFIMAIIKKIFVNIFNIHKSKKIELILLFITFSISALLALYHKNLFMIILAPIYIYSKSIFQVIASKVIAWKYRFLSELLSNNVRVIEVNGNKLKLNSFITISDIERKKEQLEMYFNQEIESIERNKNNFRLVTINLKDHNSNKKNTNKTYKLIDYIDKGSVKKTATNFLMGIDEKEKVVTCDLRKLKHMLISGEMGGGKTTFLHSLIQSLMYYNDNLAFFLIDFKRVGFTSYRDFDNVLFIKEYTIFLETLKKLNKEMDIRYDKLEKVESENIEHYDKITKSNTPRIIVIIDEIADIKFNKDNDKVEETFTRLVNMGRASGIHVIAATQRPSGVQLSTELRAGLISKVSFSVFDLTTQKMTGVIGTEDLNTGEFMTSHIKNLSGIYKGFFVDKDQTNETFNQLKEAKLKNNNKVNLDKNVNYGYLYSGSKSGSDSRTLKICPTSKSVIELILFFKNIENDISCSTEPLNEEALYNTFIDFINKNRNGNKLPLAKEIERALNISSRKRKELANKAYENKILIKPTDNSYEFI